ARWSRPQPGAGLSRRRPWARFLVLVACWLYLAALCGVWLLLALAADRWWPATLLMYGPRWTSLLPLVVLVPASLLWRRRALAVLAAALLVAGGPVMGLAVPWRAWLPGPPPRARLRVLTCNVHGHELRPEELAMLLADTDPDLVALQS